MANSGKIAPRNFPPYFMHPMHSHQPSRQEFEAAKARAMEEHSGLCLGHQSTVIHLAGTGETRRFIVEVVLKTGSYYIESPCTFTPAMGLDTLDGHLAQDAEEWVLVQQLRVRPKRLRKIFGNNDRLQSQDYVKAVSLPRVNDDEGYEFEVQTGPTATAKPATTPTPAPPKPAAAASPDAPPTEAPKKKWWKFW